MLVSAVHLSRTTQTTSSVPQYTKLKDYVNLPSKDTYEDMKMEIESTQAKEKDSVE